MSAKRVAPKIASENAIVTPTAATSEATTTSAQRRPVDDRRRITATPRRSPGIGGGAAVRSRWPKIAATSPIASIETIIGPSAPVPKMRVMP